MTASLLKKLVRAALLLQVLLLAFFIAFSHGAFHDKPKPTTTDFASFYAAGSLAAAGHAADAYDVAKLQAAEERATAPGIEHVHFLNPPVFLLVSAPLAQLPYLAAFLVFEGATLALWLALTTRIAGGGRLAALTLLAQPPVYWTAGWGQNSFLTASLMAAGTLLLRKRPGLAGLAFGCLVIKPHFGILLPVALIAARQWRAILTTGATAVALIAVSVALFGLDAWRAYSDFARHAGLTAIQTGKIVFAGHIDFGGAARLLGADATTGWGVQALASLAAAVAAGLLFRRFGRADCAESAQATRLSGLISATMIAMPFMLFYDLVMASVAAAWLVGAARANGFRRHEPAALAALSLVTFLAFPSASLLHLAIGSLVAPGLLILAMRRAIP